MTQEVFHINKQEDNVLTIDVKEWLAASKSLSYKAFKMYLYLASNENGAELPFGRLEVAKALNITLEGYKEAVEELKDKGYLSLVEGSYYEFLTTPIIFGGEC